MHSINFTLNETSSLFEARVNVNGDNKKGIRHHTIYIVRRILQFFGKIIEAHANEKTLYLNKGSVKRYIRAHSAVCLNPDNFDDLVNSVNTDDLAEIFKKLDMIMDAGVRRIEINADLKKIFKDPNKLLSDGI